MDTTSTLPRPVNAAGEALIEQPRPVPGAGATGHHGRVARFWRGSDDDPVWARPAFLGLLAATAVLYLWDLGASGWANSFYAAAAQAGSESWKAFFFGSSDSASSITVDKTPLALWPMALSVRLFGLSSWSILVPQALEGLATVALLHHVVRRTTGSAAAALVAGATMALTPVAVLMFRFDNPDSMLVLLMVAASAATLRAIEADRRALRWLALAGALVGLAFLTKMLQAFLVLPALGLVYLLFARSSWGRRIGHLVVALVSMVLAGGWWVAIVALWPASSRPYIGGSQDNSILELTLGYNGFGRLTGNEVGSVGGGGGAGGGGMWGQTGLLRLFGTDIGGQVAWLVPAALVLGVAGTVLTRRPSVRAALTLWLGWLLVTGLTFSFMAGIFHAYYTVALAPAVAALVGIGAWTLWQRRSSLVATSVLAFTIAFTAVFAWYLLDRADGFVPWLKWLVAVVGLVAAFGVAVSGHLPRRVALAAALLAIVSSVAGPAAYAVSTASTPHTGSIPTAGPSTGTGPGGGFAGPRGFRGGGVRPPGQPQNGTQAGRTGRTGGPAGGRAGGGLLNGSTSSAALTRLLRTDAASYTWVAATVGSNNASGYQLASQEPVMPIGGFNGSDPSPTLKQFERYVANGQIHYFIASGTGGGGGAGPGGNTASAITEWVGAHFTATTVGGVTVYDLSGGVT
jgi:4-amino-4-deoxy-L-arabinose transferase-like glycosyltransferase